MPSARSVNVAAATLLLNIVIVLEQVRDEMRRLLGHCRTNLREQLGRRRVRRLPGRRSARGIATAHALSRSSPTASRSAYMASAPLW